MRTVGGITVRVDLWSRANCSKARAGNMRLQCKTPLGCEPNGVSDVFRSPHKGVRALPSTSTTIAPQVLPYTNTRAIKRDRSGRRRWLAKVHQSSVGRGCRAWLLGLSTRSDDAAKPVWGMQTKQAVELGCSARTIRRYRVEAERAGLIETRHGAFERRPDGTCGRTSTNLYVFCVHQARRTGERPAHAERTRTSRPTSL